MNDITTTTTVDTGSSIFDSTVAIVAAFLSGANTPIQPDQIGALISNTYQSLNTLTQSVAVETPAPIQEPAVDPRRSVKRDHIVCLEDGKKVKMLKRYLMTNYGLTPDAYRAKWGLPADYPMVSPEYSERRRVLAQEIGLGTKGRAAKAATVEAEAKTRKPRAKKAEPAPAPVEEAVAA